MNVFNCIKLIVANDGLRWSSVEPIANLARRSSFLAGTIKKLSGDVAERSFGSWSFFPLFGKCRLDA